MGEVRSLFTRREAISRKRCVKCGCFVEKQGHKPECPNRKEELDGGKAPTRI